ncbi:uncharacterized protein LOC112342412 [Selaginella moellendorffii]|uniref:uncharacterized protein LOC112342412 n=1 Tax=Selaginella moellendorffii TaxID=88036 RepID=UPI000D1C9235|nr:uncharacterized protein LOC112342412 [Selaginella moellendorffii]XP_024519955.1 uncharacterized protein LOC112342412 [Selaginella moellendorffii]|eukprot:XP_024519954.1 uncharacterized protein LOC112342412 [Selaginella moellendorffii]
MGRMKRASAFVVAVAQKLVRDDRSAAMCRLQPLLERAIADLPSGKLRSALESDLPRYGDLLCKTVKEMLDSTQCEELPGDNLLQVSQGPVVTDAAFGKSVEAVIVAVENLAGHGERLKEWISSCRRLLVCRPDSPLALWWAYAALELHCSQDLALAQENKEKVAVHVISSAKDLMHRLRGLTTNPFAAVAAMAPVVAALSEAGSIITSSGSCPSKSWRNAVKLLELACKEVLGSIALYTSRQQARPSQTLRSDDSSSLDFRGLVLAGKGLMKLTGIENSDNKGVAKLFPLSSKAMKNSMMVESGDMETCAGIVASEAVLLRVIVSVLELRGKSEKKVDLENHDFSERLKFLAVHGADMLVDVLLDPILPVEHILNTEEELFLRGILYDVVLADLPRLNDQHLGANAKFSLFLKKIGLAQRAMEFYRLRGARTKAVELSSRLPSWSVPAGFAQWLQSSKMEGKPADNILLNPRTLIGWLTSVNEEVLASTIANCVSEKGRSKKIDQATDAEEVGNIFFVDTKGDSDIQGDKEELEAADRAFASAAECIQEEHAKDAQESAESEGGDSDESDKEEENAQEEDGGNKQESKQDPDTTGMVIIDGLRHDIEVVLVSEAALSKMEVSEPEVAVAEAAEAFAAQDAPTTIDARIDEPDEPATLNSRIDEPDEPATLYSRIDEPEDNAEKMESDQQFSTPVEEKPQPVAGAEVEETNEAKIPKIPKTPKTSRSSVVTTPQSLPVVRCTRSGRKYGDFVQQSVPASMKRRRVSKTEADAAAVAADSQVPEQVQH